VRAAARLPHAKASNPFRGRFPRKKTRKKKRRRRAAAMPPKKAKTAVAAGQPLIAAAFARRASGASGDGGGGSGGNLLASPSGGGNSGSAAAFPAAALVRCREAVLEYTDFTVNNIRNDAGTRASERADEAETAENGALARGGGAVMRVLAPARVAPAPARRWRG
jgi:hypothetical protein